MIEQVKRIVCNNKSRAGMYYLAGNLVNKAVAFLTIPFFSSMLSTRDYGIYSTYESWVSILSVVVGLSLGNTLRNAYVDYKDELKSYVCTITLFSYLSFLLLLLMGTLFGLISSVNIVLIMFCIIQSFFSNFVSTYCIKLMMESRYIVRTILIVAPNLLAMIVSILCVMLIKKDLYMGRIVPELVIICLFGVFLTGCIFTKKGVCIRWDYIRYSLPIAVPMIFHGLSVCLLSNSDRTIITLLVGEDETGIYSLIYSISMVISVVSSAVESVWIPWFTNKMIEKDKNTINDCAVIYLLFIDVMVVVFLFVSPEFVYLMADEKYWGGVNMLPPLVMSFYFIFLYSISVNVEYFYKRTRFIAINTIIAGCINLILNLIFVKRFGGVAAAYTTLLSYIISFVLHYLYAKSLDKDLFKIKIYILPISLSLICMILSRLFLNYALIRWIMAIIVASLIIITLLRKIRVWPMENKD